MLLAPLAFWLTRAGRFADYRTLAGDSCELLLPDGSHVDLSAGSALSVDYGETARRLTLHQGEAFFQVTGDSARPFVVKAGPADFTALGTAFNIRLAGDRVRLTVTEHSVLARSSAVEAVVEQGQQFALGDGATAGPRAVDSEAETAWRHGVLVFRATPLGEVIDVLARNAGWNVMLSDTAKRIPVTAMFSLSRLDEAPETIA
ncbi:FecR domain-containing protein [Paracoccus sp. AS002]|uniref:FecR family protein n=1 Tax=Paracoccus sp. AS002 TaxID=3019545 RepID=UPI0023E8C017|nr:FecR domain-containing protein [Paracoccus sp. AS002]MDF3906305.1 FecR domain-containing protein [Paracoccus sp. AS002]